MAKNKKLLILILIVAAGLRLINLSSGNALGDEVLYAFRAIGPMDFDVPDNQSTPWMWFDESNPSINSGHLTGVPWWSKLSWHDHPPLVFWVQHLFIKLLGENNFAFRFPSALLGIASVYLIYLIGRRLSSENLGLISALLMGVTVNSVFISRVGLQESYVIFFILLSLYLFLKSLSNNKYLIWTGVAIGFAGLTKYTALIVIPIILAYLALYKRDYLKDKKFWLGMLLALVIFSPVIIYNLELYKSVGHFDFQFSYIFNQHPKEWPVAPGKEEIGSLGDRIKNFVPQLIYSNSWIFLILFVVSLVSIFYRRYFSREVIFLFIWLLFQLLLFVFVGPTRRFLTMLTPVIILMVGGLVSNLRRQYILLPIIIFEFFYSINSQIINYPWGRAVWAYSPVRNENYNWGYNELDNFLTFELKNKFPTYIFDSKYKFIADAQTESVERAKIKGYSSYPALIIYDQNIYNIPQLWILDRRQVYHGWPVIKTEAYLALPEKNVFKNNYFIMPTNILPLKDKATSAGGFLEKDLIISGIKPILLKNKKGEEVFKIYKF